jgi:hypothetical protein
MKTLILVILVCCANEKSNNGYEYEAKNLETNVEGKLYSPTKYNVGDTVVMSLK